ncbi:hypothetical protein HU200_059957 [Digitaria exilis]|uniref:Uncharacterized protein n=1 Tax=Digitaria exilis TaxID=1010633 RepID=A0A835ABX3_9POAL|nr:hypothetical protein HU200_059957 [Digitaria exilis]
MAAVAGWVVGNARVRGPAPRHVADSAVGIASPCISIIVARPCGEDYDSGGRDGEGCVLSRLAEGRNWTRCPSCRAVIDKIHGCTRIVCR